MTAVHAARFDELTPQQLYGILRLRAEVFVVEQACVYLDPDGLDAHAIHLWIDADADGGSGRVVACARVMGSVIGRVVTAADHRRRGLGSMVMARALELATPPATLNAQSHLAHWYEGFGFAAAGEEFIEDGIPHVPMIRS